MGVINRSQSGADTVIVFMTPSASARSPRPITKDFPVEEYLFYVLVAGAGLIVLSLLWLVVAAFRQRVLWGLACLLVVGMPFFLWRHWPRARGPVGLLLFGAVVLVAPFAINRVQQYFIDFGPREKMVDGELHITLTGWDRTDYSMLRARPTTVVLQMANPDVTDATLDYLTDMPQLRELDLNDTKITDAGLAKLAKIGTLTTLRLKNTAATEDGFREHLMPLPGLRELDLRGTKVASATVREWRAAQPERKALR
jgi:hypothetical protein